MSIQDVQSSQSVSNLGFNEPAVASENENPRVNREEDVDPKLRAFLTKWKLALINANNDDWGMVVNTYSLLKRELFVFPVEIECIFSPSLEGDLIEFIRSQQRLRDRVLNLIQTHLLTRHSNS